MDVYRGVGSCAAPKGFSVVEFPDVVRAAFFELYHDFRYKLYLAILIRGTAIRDDLFFLPHVLLGFYGFGFSGCSGKENVIRWGESC